jgi:hypothetical protein
MWFIHFLFIKILTPTPIINPITMQNKFYIKLLVYKTLS